MCRRRESAVLVNRFVKVRQRLAACRRALPLAHGPIVSFVRASQMGSISLTIQQR